MLAGTNEDLAKIARIALQLPVTQVSIESVFSSLKYVLNDLRVLGMTELMLFWFFVLIIETEQLVFSASTLYVLRCYTKLVE